MTLSLVAATLVGSVDGDVTSWGECLTSISAEMENVKWIVVVVVVSAICTISCTIPGTQTTPQIHFLSLGSMSVYCYLALRIQNDTIIHILNRDFNNKLTSIIKIINL